ncbi:MAG: hypothetical protein AB1591_12365, partial [Pseudomonadota bacterium]
MPMSDAANIKRAYVVPADPQANRLAAITGTDRFMKYSEKNIMRTGCAALMTGLMLAANVPVPAEGGDDAHYQEMKAAGERVQQSAEQWREEYRRLREERKRLLERQAEERRREAEEKRRQALKDEAER